MPLPDLMYRQVAELCRFFEPSARRLWVFRHLADLQPAVLKMLAGIQNDEDNANVFVYCDAPFLNAEQYAGRLLGEFEAELNELAAGFEVAGVSIPAPLPASGTAADQLARRADAVAEAFPESSGSLVFILDPLVVSDAGRFARGLAVLAEAATSPRTKFLVLDGSKSPDMDRLRERGGQDFKLDPASIEAEVAADLAGDELTRPERRQYLAMAGSFAFAKGDVEKAAALQSQSLDMAAEDGDASGVATGLYGLGNTALKAKRPGEAEAWFLYAAEACMHARNDNLLGMTLVGLGVALHRQGKSREALKSFDAGRSTFQRLNSLVGEVHALDTKATALAEASQADAARAAWQEAVALVDGMSNEGFTGLRQSCREDLVGKLQSVGGVAL
jgi:tetratricopeptide (TPR) repeat protein